MADLDVAFVRDQFPAFAEPSLAGWAYLENAGGSYACRQVIERLARYYTATKVQPHHPYPAAEAAGQAMEAGPQRLAAWLNVPADHVHVGPSTSQNTYVLARALDALLQPGDAVVVTQQDHEANSGVWRRLAEARGLSLREWAVDPTTGRLDQAGLEAILDDHVALVAFPHVSNIIGEFHPVASWCALAHQVGALTVVDGVAAAPHGLPDVASLHADVYLFSTYKTFGPHQGVMVIAPDLADRLPNQGHFFNAALRRKRLAPAGPDPAQVAALAGVADYLDGLDRHHFASRVDAPAERIARLNGLLHAHEQALLAPLMDHLGQLPGVRVLGPTAARGRAPTVSIVCDRPGVEVARALSDHRVAAGGDHFYAYRLLQAVGVDPDHGVLRLSAVHYTSPGEVIQAIEALDAATTDRH